MNKLYFILFIFIIHSKTKSQSSERYEGIIRIKNGSSFPYVINLKKDSIGNISGYSIFNPQKEFETKSLLKGFIKNKILEFKEYALLSSSKSDKHDICYIHYKGKIKDVFNTTMYVGDFEGYLNNGKKCAEGSLSLLAKDKYLKKIDSVSKIKIKSNELDSSKLNIVSNYKKFIPVFMGDNSSTNIYWNSDTLFFKVWDSDKVDNDNLSISVNGVQVIANLKLTENEFLYKEIITQNTTIVLKALNVGFIGPNTSNINFDDGGLRYYYLNNLNEGKKATFNIFKK